MRLEKFEVDPSYETLYFSDGRTQTEHSDNSVTITLTHVSDEEVDQLTRQFRKPTDS